MKFFNIPEDILNNYLHKTAQINQVIVTLHPQKSQLFKLQNQYWFKKLISRRQNKLE